MKLLISFGTRPEFIKVKSLIDNIDQSIISLKTVFTGQHTDLLNNVMPTYRINIDTSNFNRLNGIIESIIRCSYIFDDITHVLVQGDTTSAFAIALSAFNHGITVIHLEAGLRTYIQRDPWPEEANRQLIAKLASVHLCPTELNKENLLKEQTKGDIHVTGNTGLDNISLENIHYGNIVLVTFHRRDNIPIMDKWFESLSNVANKYKDLMFILPLHPNPQVQQYKDKLKGIKIVEPLPHNELIIILKKCRFVISDSGGIQEEASYLNKKIIVCRKYTERTESLNIHSILCTDPQYLLNIIDDLYINYEINAPCPYGSYDTAWKKIINILYNIKIEI